MDWKPIYAPIFVDGERYGTLNFSSPKPCRPFIRQDYELVKLFAEWVGHEVARTRDIRAMEILTEKMKIMANTDALTGLNNRRFVEEALHQLVKRANDSGMALSVALIDFDHFKLINDTYGHAIGDDVLKLFGSIAPKVGRKMDLYGRWGAKSS
nr:sensor domain-containing diguanylate cyclase [Vibrio mexicanus]